MIKNTGICCVLTLIYTKILYSFPNGSILRYFCTSKEVRHLLFQLYHSKQPILARLQTKSLLKQVDDIANIS